MDQHQPALVDLDRAPAIAELDELPNPTRRQNLRARVPMVEVIGFQQRDIFMIQPPQHCILPVNSPRKQRQPLVDRSGSAQSVELECFEVGRAQQLLANLLATEGGISA